MAFGAYDIWALQYEFLAYRHTRIFKIIWHWHYASGWWLTFTGLAWVYSEDNLPLNQKNDDDESRKVIITSLAKFYSEIVREYWARLSCQICIIIVLAWECSKLIISVVSWLIVKISLIRTRVGEVVHHLLKTELLLKITRIRVVFFYKMNYYYLSVLNVLKILNTRFYRISIYMLICRKSGFFSSLWLVICSCLYYYIF
jgi:hypothetical protein